MHISGKRDPSKEIIQFKGPEVGIFLACYRNSKAVQMVGRESTAESDRRLG